VRHIPFVAYFLLVFGVFMVGFGSHDHRLARDEVQRLQLVGGVALALPWALLVARLLSARLRAAVSASALVGLGIMAVLFVVPALGRAAMVGRAEDSNARRRVQVLQAVVDLHRAGKKGALPDARALARLWKDARPDDYATSPWGGAVGPGAPDGVVVLPPFPATEADGMAALAAADAGGLAADPSRRGAVVFARVVPAGGKAWRGFLSASTRAPAASRHYVVGIYGPDGAPFWDVLGGQ
jgi:hypothetical protein